MPEQRPEDGWSRWLRGALLALGLAAAGAVVYQTAGGDLLDRAPWSADASPGGEAGRAAAAADTGSRESGEGGESRDPASRLPADYGDRADELRSAIRRFREQMEDHRLGRIGCPELARGYEEVDRTMVDLARAYVEARERLGSSGEELYDRVMAAADTAGRYFDASGCERVP